MNPTTQAVLDWSRTFISDPKTRVKAVRGEFLGRTALPTASRETFFINQTAIGTVSLYVKPYRYVSAATFNGAVATDKKFLFNPTLQSCTFPASTDTPIRPAQFRDVYAEYEFTEQLPYAFRDTELTEYLPQAVEYLNNNYSLTFAYTGTISTFALTSISAKDKEIISRSLALIVRKTYVSEQIRRGLGVAFRGPMAAIDSKTQLTAYNKQTTALEQSIADKMNRDETTAAAGSGQSVDIYDEGVVSS